MEQQLRAKKEKFLPIQDSNFYLFSISKSYNYQSNSFTGIEMIFFSLFIINLLQYLALEYDSSSFN
tara:strand:+ start:23 stop:220 length:198 start_codon:yes stop_codon:yes gene_type:complete